MIPRLLFSTSAIVQDGLKTGVSVRTQRSFLPLLYLSILVYLSTHLARFAQHALMSCPIHWNGSCTCYNASLQYTTSITTTTASSPFGPQAGNIFVGYELATPLVTTSGAWHPVESVVIQPSTPCSEQGSSQPDCYRLANMYETWPLHPGYRRESRVHEQEQKLAPFSREQVRSSFLMIRLKLTPSQLATRRMCPTPYIQGVSRVALPNSYSDSLVPLVRAHQGGTSGSASYDLVSPVESAISNPDSYTLFDEPPPPYQNNALVVGNSQGDIFSSAVLPAETLLNIGPITPSPVAPVPLRHSSLYQVLKQDSRTSLAQGTLRSQASSIAHALEPQEPPARQVPPSCTPALRDRQNTTIGRPELLLNTELAASTSLTAVAMNPSPILPQLPSVDLARHAQAQSPVSCATPTRVMAPAQGVSVVTPLEAHTLADPLPDAPTHDYDMLPRLRKVSRPCPCPTTTMPYTRAYESTLVPLSSSQQR
jgi:hypothetical protein